MRLISVFALGHQVLVNKLFWGATLVSVSPVSSILRGALPTPTRFPEREGEYEYQGS